MGHIAVGVEWGVLNRGMNNWGTGLVERVARIQFRRIQRQSSFTSTAISEAYHAAHSSAPRFPDTATEDRGHPSYMLKSTTQSIQGKCESASRNLRFGQDRLQVGLKVLRS